MLEQRGQVDRLLGFQASPTVESRLDGIQAMLRQMQATQLPALAAELGATRDALQPMRATLDELWSVGAAMGAMLPMRRTITRMRCRH